MRSRPHIDVEVPDVLRPGESFEITVILESATRTPVHGVTISLERQEILSNGPEVPPEVRRVVSFDATIGEDSVLEENGVARFVAEIPLPIDAPPTFDGKRLRVDWFVDVHVSIPWWPDARSRFPVEVAPKEEPRPQAETIVQRSRGEGAFIEVALNDRVFAPGDTIQGAIAVGDAGGRKLERVSCELYAIERFAPDYERVESKFSSLELEPDVEEGREITFSLNVDEHARPSFQSPAGGASLSWELLVSAYVGLRYCEHAIPLKLGSFGAGGRRATATHLPVGVGRWGAVWREEAARAALAFDAENGEITGEASSARLRVAADVARSQRTLVAELSYASLGVDLRVREKPEDEDEAQGSSGVELEGGQLSRTHVVSARDPAQLVALLVPSFRRALQEFVTVDLADDHAVVRSKLPWTEPSGVRAFLEAARDLARELEALVPLVPPPPTMTELVPAWRRFAEEHDATLELGSMRLLDVSHEGSLFELRTAFKGAAPSHAVLSLRCDPPLPLRVNEHDAADLDALPSDTRALLASLGHPSRPARVRPGEIQIDLDGVVRDPAAVRPLMDGMLALAAALRRERSVGFYR